MGRPDQQNSKDTFPLSAHNLALRDITLVADDLMPDVTSLPQVSSASTGPKPNSYTVELFRDEARVTATELLYGHSSYALKDIDSLQISKLHRKRSIFQKKVNTFLASIVATAGLLLLLNALTWFIYVLNLILIIGSISYAIYFNWWIEQRRRGEFGLVMTMKPNAKVVITSHSLKAIQTLYQLLFRRMDMSPHTNESLTVNMYTGEILNDY
ncbi:DUF6232 family protein [Leptolyngbya sp. Heron Island J]|uniref:DUF6232 family protein n=1 Tax=Leptolyngbya sp. Heron Island J TaxID=1385935 RepID=UPI0013777C5A|nr:DUF6232 family protein [Leptolyngbya sp. Heron Island J]